MRMWLKIRGCRGQGRSDEYLCVLKFREQHANDKQIPCQLAFLLGAYYSGVSGWQCGWPACGSCSHLIPGFPGAMARVRGFSREPWLGSQDGGSQALLLHCSVTLDRPLGLSGPLFLVYIWRGCFLSVPEKHASGNNDLMVCFMCQFGWAMVSRYVVKHYSGCLWEGVFG